MSQRKNKKKKVVFADEIEYAGRKTNFKKKSAKNNNRDLLSDSEADEREGPKDLPWNH